MPSDKDIKDFALIIPLTRGKVAIVDLEDYHHLSRFKWHAFKGRSGWYARRGLSDRAWEWMHRLVAGAVKGQKVDHQNGDGLDNRRANLRIATSSQNKFNMPKQLRNKSGYKGVYFRQGRGWAAQISANNRKFHLGHYKTAEEAATVYDNAAREKHGEYARLNFPD